MRQAVISLSALVLGLSACQADPQSPAVVLPGPIDANAAPLFSITPTPTLTADQERLLTLIRNRPTVLELHVATIRPNAPQLLRSGQPLRFDVSPSVRFVAEAPEVTEDPDGTIFWRGELQGVFGTVQSVLTSTGFTASLHTGAALYKFEPIGGALHALTRVGNFPPD